MPVTNLDELFEKYKPIPNPIGGFLSHDDDGKLYDWSLKDLRDQNIPANRVVSISMTDVDESEDDEDECPDVIYSFAVGIHSSIACDFLITSVPITEDFCFEY